MKSKWLLALPLIAGVSVLGVACDADQTAPPQDPPPATPTDPADPAAPGTPGTPGTP